MPTTTKPAFEAQPIVTTERRAVIDQMDTGLDILRTCELALLADGWVDDDAIKCVCSAMHSGLKFLAAVRERVNEAHGADRI